MQAVLGDLDGDLRQLGDLVAGGLAGLLVALVEAVPAAAAPRPMLHHPVDRLDWQELASLAPVAGLGALRSSGGIGALALGRARRVLARRVEEFCELRFRRRLSSAISSPCLATCLVSCWICSSIRSKTATTVSRPAS